MLHDTSPKLNLRESFAISVCILFTNADGLTDIKATRTVLLWREIETVVCFAAISCLVLQVYKVLQIVCTSHVVLFALRNHFLHQAPKELLHSRWYEPTTVILWSLHIRSRLVVWRFFEEFMTFPCKRRREMRGKNTRYVQIAHTDLNCLY
jgi:hypothetical protein